MDCKQHDGFARSCANGFHPNEVASCNHLPAGQTAGHALIGLSPAEIVRLLRSHVRLWVIPAVVCTVLAATYALLASRDWRATQAMIVRPEAASASNERLGKFSDLSEMKTLQETILELAKSQGVIEATLRQVGPSNGRATAAWPTPKDIEEFRGQVDMRPPGGAEFGKTEVFYLAVLDSNRDWAARTLAVLCGELEKRMQELRDERAQGMVAELKRAVSIAEADLAERTNKLSTFEAGIGADLSELRNLNATVGGQGEVSQELLAIESERRANEALRRENERLLTLLVAAQNDPSKLLATPNSLLRSQPPVNRLKDALVDAQVRTSHLQGTRSERHPLVAAARTAEESIQAQLHAEISVAIQSVQLDLNLNADREQSLLAKWLQARERIGRLAEFRAEYANLVSATENHSRLVEAALKNLGDARSRQAAAHSASVISRIDGVEAGVRPVGPGRTTITAAGGVGGLILGFGLVFLFATSPNSSSSAELRPSQVVATPVATASPARPSREKFGLFAGMTLEEAIRSVEGVNAR